MPPTDTDPLRRPYRLLRLVGSAAPWRASAYLSSYLLLGPVLFAFSLAVLVLSFILSITMLGQVLLVIAAAVLRGCAHVERARVGLVGDPVAAAYRSVEPTGIVAAFKARWSDPATLRDVGYLIGLFVPLLVLDAVALWLWLTSLALCLVPSWYWAVPDGGAIGLLRIDTLPAAIAAGLVACAVLPVTAYAVIAAARLHSTVTRAVLGPRNDPLFEAKRLLAQPGPLATGVVPAPASPVRPRGGTCDHHTPERR